MGHRRAEVVFTAASAEKRRVESRAEEKAMALGTTLCSRQRGRHHKEAPDKSKQKDILHTSCRALFKTVKVMKDKERLKNYCSRFKK